jgi:predicted metal-dependent peptidase
VVVLWCVDVVAMDATGAGPGGPQREDGGEGQGIKRRRYHITDDDEEEEEIELERNQQNKRRSTEDGDDDDEVVSNPDDEVDEEEEIEGEDLADTWHQYANESMLTVSSGTGTTPQFLNLIVMMPTI